MATDGADLREPRVAHLLFADARTAPFWLLVRLYVGWEWLAAGWEKVQNPSWVGGNAGAAIVGFVNGALKKTAGDHPDVTGWYAWFLEHAVLPHAGTWSVAVSFGEGTAQFDRPQRAAAPRTKRGHVGLGTVPGRRCHLGEQREVRVDRHVIAKLHRVVLCQCDGAGEHGGEKEG